MNYIQHQLNGDVERILYYARLQAEHSDIKFIHFRLNECIEEALLDLVRKYAEKLCAEVHLASQLPFESGFGIELIFTL